MLRISSTLNDLNHNYYVCLHALCSRHMTVCLTRKWEHVSWVKNTYWIRQAHALIIRHNNHENIPITKNMN